MVYKHAISTVVPSRPVSHHSNTGTNQAGTNYSGGNATQQDDVAE